METFTFVEWLILAVFMVGLGQVGKFIVIMGNRVYKFFMGNDKE